MTVVEETALTPSGFRQGTSQIVEDGTLQGVESVPQGCWPILTPMLPTVVSSCLDVLWVVDHSSHGKLLSVKNPEALQFLTQTGAPGTCYHTPFKGTL